MEKEIRYKDPNRYFLEGMYKNVKISSERTVSVLPKVENRAMISDMTASLMALSGFASKIEVMMHERGIEPSPPGFLSKIGAAAGMGLGTLVDRSEKNIARLCSAASLNNIKRLSAMCDDMAGRCDSAMTALCDDIVAGERINCERMEAYL